MKSARGSSSSFQGNGVNGVDLILTGLPMQVLQRPSSASPGKHIARSISVITENKPKRNILVSIDVVTSIILIMDSKLILSFPSFSSSDHHDDFLTLFNSSSTGRKKLASLSKDSPEKKTTWNILGDRYSILAGDAPANILDKLFWKHADTFSFYFMRSNKGAMGNCVTTMVHNNYSTTDKISVPKSSNQATTSLNNIIKATSNEDPDSSSYMKSQKNFSSSNILAWNNNTSSSSPPTRIQEVSEEEAERFVNQVNSAAVTIQRWYRRHSQRHKEGVAQLERLLASKREVWQHLDLQQRRDGERKKIREEKARLARRAAIQVAICLLILLVLGIRRQDCLGLKVRPSMFIGGRGKFSPAIQDLDSISLTTDNLEKFGKLNCSLGAPEEGTLLSETKLQNIMSFLDEMEKSEQERPRSVASASQQEVNMTHLNFINGGGWTGGSIQKLKLEVEEKKRAVAFLQRALAQQQELTGQHVKDVQKELTHQLTMQREQYEGAIQRHLAFIDQLIDDKRALNQKCEAVVSELKLVDQKYTKKIAQMQEQHELAPQDTEALHWLLGLSGTLALHHAVWTSWGFTLWWLRSLEPEIQKLIAKHKLEIKKLKSLHEVELLQSDERAAQRYIRQTEELREMLEHEKEEQGQRERELARQRPILWHSSLIPRQRAELEDLRRQLEENNSIVTKTLKEEYEKGKEEQERRHQVGGAFLCSLQETWLLTRERELREEVRKERDKEIELVIQKLEADMSSAKDECERINKEMRDKYELDLRELDLSERKFQERCNELKGRLLEAEKEQEIEDIRKDQLAQERSSLSEVIRQEFADRLVTTEEDNKHLKIEMAELRAHQRLELDRVIVKTAIVKKEEAVNSFRKQYEVRFCEPCQFL
uniref:Centrosomal protein 131 n=1 Tax=Naja naja TaxID=35670 RepID=A0A8C6V7E6_NAJNA